MEIVQTRSHPVPLSSIFTHSFQNGLSHYVIFLPQVQNKSSQLYIEFDTVIRQLNIIDLIPCVYIYDQGRNFFKLIKRFIERHFPLL